MISTATLRSSPRVRNAVGAKRAPDNQNLTNTAKKTIAEVNSNVGQDISSLQSPTADALAPPTPVPDHASTPAAPPPQPTDNDAPTAVAQPPANGATPWIEAYDDDDTATSAVNAAAVVSTAAAVSTDEPFLSASAAPAATPATVVASRGHASHQPQAAQPAATKQPPGNLDGMFAEAAHEPPTLDVHSAAPAPCTTSTIPAVAAAAAAASSSQ